MPIKKVLVVEDSPTERHALGEMLAAQGYEVVFAENGEIGIAKAKSEQPDLIIMDVLMPGMNGFQATREITRAPETRHIPIIICTTKGQETDKIWGMRQGARGYIVKPIGLDDLTSKVAALN